MRKYFRPRFARTSSPIGQALTGLPSLMIWLAVEVETNSIVGRDFLVNYFF
jgi:hypothetical protein